MSENSNINIFDDPFKLSKLVFNYILEYGHIDTEAQVILATMKIHRICSSDDSISKKAYRLAQFPWDILRKGPKNEKSALAALKLLGGLIQKCDQDGVLCIINNQATRLISETMHRYQKNLFILGRCFKIIKLLGEVESGVYFDFLQLNGLNVCVQVLRYARLYHAERQTLLWCIDLLTAMTTSFTALPKIIKEEDDVGCFEYTVSCMVAWRCDPGVQRRILKFLITCASDESALAHMKNMEIDKTLRECAKAHMKHDDITEASLRLLRMLEEPSKLKSKCSEKETNEEKMLERLNDVPRVYTETSQVQQSSKGFFGKLWKGIKKMVK